MPNVRRPLVVLGAALVALPLTVASPAHAAKAKAAPAAAQNKPQPPTWEERYQALHFRLVGPFRGGRVTAVAGVRGVPGTFYMGSTGGGVWKTVDNGITWVNVSDLERDPEAPEPKPMGETGIPASEPPAHGVTPTAAEQEKETQRRRQGDRFDTASVGAVAVAESDPNVVYVGMGSACIRGNVSPGDGVYKSTDGGKTWYHMGLDDAGQIARVRVHPKDSGPRLRRRPRPRLRRQQAARRLPLARTAARPGRTSSTSATTPAPSTCRWTRPTRAFSTPPPGRRCASPGT